MIRQAGARCEPSGQGSEELEQSSGYRARRKAIAAFNAQNKFIKRGIALTPVKFGISFTLIHLNQAGALTIAIATEFAVILSGRFEQERSVGLDVAAALRRAYERTGAAVLVASDIRMLRDFGAVTVIDLAAALLGVIVILPATLVMVERRRPAGGGTTGNAGAGEPS